jgi:hypothetical protein
MDGRLSSLPGADADARALSDVLSDGLIGDFAVQVVQNETRHAVARAVQLFFSSATPDDLLLLHLSCHGLKDFAGRLHFATRDTEVDLLAATAVGSGLINDLMEESHSQQIVVLLDCCFSGAFVKGMRTRSSDHSVDVAENFEGKGRFVITSSTSLQYSYESEERTREQAKPSVFTSAVVDSLRSGTADRDGDGKVGAEEFYQEVRARVGRTLPSQTPTLSVNSAIGELVIAYNPAGPAQRSGVPVAAAPVVVATTPSGRPPFDTVEGGGYDIGQVNKRLDGVIAAVADPRPESPARPPYFSLVSGKRHHGYDMAQVDAHVEAHRAEPVGLTAALRELLTDLRVGLVSRRESESRKLVRLAKQCGTVGDERLIGYVKGDRQVTSFTDTHLCVLNAAELLRAPYSRVQDISLSTSSRTETWGGGNDQGGYGGVSYFRTTSVFFTHHSLELEECDSYPMCEVLTAFLPAMKDLRRAHPDWFS